MPEKKRIDDLEAEVNQLKSALGKMEIQLRDQAGLLLSIGRQVLCLNKKLKEEKIRNQKSVLIESN